MKKINKINGLAEVPAKLVAQLFPGKTAKGGKKVQQILEATLKCMSKEGLEHTSFQKVAQRLDVQPSHLNYYFRTKDEMIQESIRYAVARLQEVLVEALQDSEPQKYLESYFHCFFTFLAENSHYQIIFPSNVQLAPRNPLLKQLHNKTLSMAGERLLEMATVDWKKEMKFSESRRKEIAHDLQLFVVGSVMDFTANSCKIESVDDYCMRCVRSLKRIAEGLKE